MCTAARTAHAAPCARVPMSVLSRGLRRLRRPRSWGGAAGPLGTWRCSQTQATTKRSEVTLGLVIIVTCLRRMGRRRQSTPVGFFALVVVNDSATCGAGPTWNSVGPTGSRGLGKRRRSKTGNSSTTWFGHIQHPPQLALLWKGLEPAAKRAIFLAARFAGGHSRLSGEWAQGVSGLRARQPLRANLALRWTSDTARDRWRRRRFAYRK